MTEGYQNLHKRPRFMQESVQSTSKGGSRVIALDPGICTFMTGHDPSGMAIEWEKNDICRLCHIHDRLQSKRDMIHGKGNKQLDRDINGARKILLRYLTKKESVY
ncbi:46115_t:CDS:2 [Gigaspora margarita]|uniref:46115_t:CDS:1 n=1 Tax=Gigaspora margarita TaxID=4874 RepID=A0ABN7USE9_GIGMA|nr:46115_t:CDS:2 [Gigaspora margarita]